MNPQQLTGLTDTHLVEVNLQNQTLKIHPHVLADLRDLINAAETEGFTLKIASGFRAFDRQKLIWNRKYSGQLPVFSDDGSELDHTESEGQTKVFSILRWSALPGASRHHWGTDFDIYAGNLLPDGARLQLEPWEYLSGHQKAFYDWLLPNLHRFGFFFPYAKDKGGVAPEPWHISHRISREFLPLLSKSVLLQAIETEEVSGFSVISSQFDRIYRQYVTNICEE